MHRRIWAVAGPAILANSASPLLGLVDTWAVGHLPGPVHLASVGLGSVIFNYIFWAFGFLRMGTTGLVAQAWGAGDTPRLNAEILRGSVMAVLLGLALLALQEGILALSLAAMAPPGEVAAITADYFRIRIWAAPASLLIFVFTGVLFGLGRTRAILALQLVLNATNGVLNVWFVVGLDLGVPGVALGTLLAQWLTVALAARVILRTTGAQPLRDTLLSGRTWLLARLKRVVAINGFIFVRTILLMTALAMIMREAAVLGELGMAASQVVNQYMFLVALGLDGFAHAAEALAGGAWGKGLRAEFRRWVALSTAWAVAASLAYSAFFWLAGDGITALLTDIPEVRDAVSTLMPLVVALPVVSVWCYQFDGIYIGATAAAAMMVTMAAAFAVYAAVMGPMTEAFGLRGLWGAFLVFCAVRGAAQAAWYPRLESRLVG